jgi:2-succinyl-5-enolpyruvyl-6-hydroxy-3-cyclohexene-1-carboxylate synthase
VVIDNDGGGIFTSVEAGLPAYAEHFERVFGTPMGRDLVAYGEATGVPSTRVRDVASLRAELQANQPGAGVRLVVCEVGSRTAEQAVLKRIGSLVGSRVVDA